MAKRAWSMPMQHGRICWREKMSIKCRLSWKGRGNCVREGPQKIEAFSIKRGGGLACRWAFFHQKQVFFAPLYALFSVSLKWKIEKMSIRGDGLSDTWCKMPYIFAFFGLLPKLFLIYGKKSRVWHLSLRNAGTQDRSEWHFWLHNQNGVEKRWTLSGNN